MFRTAAIARNPHRLQRAKTKSIPAPVKGWNDRDSLANMDDQNAVILDNFFPLPSKVVLRKGSTAWSTGYGAAVESLMAYQPQSGSGSMFSASGTAFYDATSSGAVGAAVVSGLTNARWQHTNIATSGGSFLMAVNGADKLRGYNGTAWWADGDGTHDITGVDTSTCIAITTFKRRVWLTQKGTASAWYLPTDSIAGAAQKLDLGPLFIHGGYLATIANWTIDGGNGPDDYSAFIGSNGDVVVYRGTDPASATTWAIVGVFYIGAPIGRRCYCQYGNDVIIISQDGLGLFSHVLAAERVNTASNLSDNIQNSISDAVTLYGSNFGWQVLPFSGENMLILNVPVATGQQQQYVMNTITGAWCRFRNWYANVWEVFNSALYYGGASAVYKAWNGKSDAGANINGEALQAFNYFGNRDSQKQFTFARPVVAVSNSAGFLFGINVDYDITPPNGVPTFTSSNFGQWGSPNKWNSAKWGGQPQIQKNWQSVVGIGNSAAMHIKAASNAGIVEWSSTDYAFVEGGVL